MNRIDSEINRIESQRRRPRRDVYLNMLRRIVREVAQDITISKRFGHKFSDKAIYDMVHQILSEKAKGILNYKKVNEIARGLVNEVKRRL